MAFTPRPVTFNGRPVLPVDSDKIRFGTMPLFELEFPPDSDGDHQMSELQSSQRCCVMVTVEGRPNGPYRVVERRVAGPLVVYGVG